jgi:hypothetical protein
MLSVEPPYSKLATVIPISDPVINSTAFQKNILDVNLVLLNLNITIKHIGVIICHQEKPRMTVGNTKAQPTRNFPQYGVRSP